MLTIVLRDDRLSMIDYSPETYLDMINHGLVDLQYDIAAGSVRVLAISAAPFASGDVQVKPDCSDAYPPDLSEALENLSFAVGDLELALSGAQTTEVTSG